ncbi:bifunctional rhamnulose-1-phosphate aldolase/short-chain dehydrogenase [Candidatus Nitrospira bockiana]
MKSRWSPQEATGLEGPDLLVYATQLIGADSDLVLWGGGNSSLKMTAPDHTGRPTRILWIKGSGSDMRTITPKQLTPLRLDDLLLLQDREAMTDEEMVAYQLKCSLQPGAPNPSIETLLHAFIPAPHVYHTHADAICALTDVRDTEATIERVFGNDVAVVPYVRPGFTLAKMVGAALRERPGLKALILDKHGLVTWGDTPQEAYQETVHTVEKAERFIEHMTKRHAWPVGHAPSLSTRDRRRIAADVALALRGAVSRPARKVLSYDASAEVLHFLEGKLAKELSQVGPFTPDHILHTKAKPLFLDVPQSETPAAIDQTVQKAVQAYRDDYVQSFERYKAPGMSMQDPNPRVILIPGVGMFTSGKDRRACRIAHDLYVHTIRVVMATSSFDRYTTLSPKDKFEFEYWPMELHKLSLLPPEKELSRRIALVTGAAGALGRAIAAHLVSAGASVILTDIDHDKVQALSAELNAKAGEENTTAVAMDVTKESSVEEAFEKALLAYGGLDIVVSNAGIARGGAVEHLSLEDWNRSLAVNATGHFLVCRRAMKAFRAQNLGGNIVVVATKNVLAPGKEFGAYSASKAAQAQLARILALEGADIGVRVNMVNPDGILEGSGIWSKEVREARAHAYGIQVDKLEDYCASRNLLHVKVTAEDVAQAVLFLASDRSAKTTGSMIPVDGGVREAFPR